MNIEKWSDRQKHNIRQYERMQDILVSYASLAIKTTTLISSGALVAIGAAFVNFLSISPDNSSATLLMKNGLSSSFEFFSLALLLNVLGLFFLYIYQEHHILSLQMNINLNKISKIDMINMENYLKF